MIYIHPTVKSKIRKIFNKTIKLNLFHEQLCKKMIFFIINMHTWIKKISSTTGKVYYVNIETNQSSWYVPKNESRLSPIRELDEK
jgi:hypothetical protein